MTSIDTSQQARYTIDAVDDRGFAVDASFQVTVTTPDGEPSDGVVTAAITEAEGGTASGKDELLVVAVAPGSALVKVFDPANPDTIFGSDAVDVIAGGVATVTLGAPTVEEQGATPPPPPGPEPTPA